MILLYGSVIPSPLTFRHRFRRVAMPPRLENTSNEISKRFGKACSVRPSQFARMACSSSRITQFNELRFMATGCFSARFESSTFLTAGHGFHLTRKPDSSYFPTISNMSGCYPLFMGRFCLQTRYGSAGIVLCLALQRESDCAWLQYSET